MIKMQSPGNSMCGWRPSPKLLQVAGWLPAAGAGQACSWIAAYGWVFGYCAGFDPTCFSRSSNVWFSSPSPVSSYFGRGMPAGRDPGHSNLQPGCRKHTSLTACYSKTLPRSCKIMPDTSMHQ